MPSYRDYENRNRVTMSAKKAREYRRKWGLFTKRDLRAIIRLARRDDDKAVVRGAQSELRKRERKRRYKRRAKSQYIYVMGKWVKV